MILRTTAGVVEGARIVFAQRLCKGRRCGGACEEGAVVYVRGALWFIGEIYIVIWNLT